MKNRFFYLLDFLHSFTATRPSSLPIGPKIGDDSTKEIDFFTKQARLQIEARMALAQAKDMAHMQMEVIVFTSSRFFFSFFFVLSQTNIEIVFSILIDRLIGKNKNNLPSQR